jgi:hypothetical protein
VTNTARSLLLVLLLAGCSPDDPSSRSPAVAAEPPAPATADSDVARPGDGLQAASPPQVTVGPGEVAFVLPGGQTRRLEFGTELERVVTAISASAGEATTTAVVECGLDAASWENGLSIYGSEGRFAGWSLREPGITTMSGVGLGSTLEEVAATYALERVPDSTLGIEYTAGDMALIMDEEGSSGRVAHLWAGITCVAR